MNIVDIQTRGELADLLDIPRSKLTYILYVIGVDNLYESFDIPKKDGSSRHIHAPQKDLKKIQRKLAEVLCSYQNSILQENNINSYISHAFQKGKSFITNARIHRNRCFVINIDLENFFESFHFGRVRGYFINNKNFKLSTELSTVIAQLTCYKGNLPQGAPTSPIITNLICNILDIRLLKLARKYRLNYTRYADDLTFSTNNKYFLNASETFFVDLKSIIEHSGFKINNKKTRIQYKDSRQEVTGLIVNEKLHVNRDYYKKTRAMANQLYRTGGFFINEEVPGTINQLEGRFSYINQLEWYNNKYNSKNNKHNYENLSGREKEYRQFIFFKYFFNNPKPIIITEGKTDIMYLKAALKNLWSEYPELISRIDDKHFEYKISFLKRSKRLDYFFNFKVDGADTFSKLYNFFCDNNNVLYPNYIKFFKNICNKEPTNPVIMLFDNELNNNEKPVSKFLKNKKEVEDKQNIVTNSWTHMIENLYLLVTPLTDGNQESDIETLFDNDVLSVEIGGKRFCKQGNYDVNKFYGKDIFSKHVMKHYYNIDFRNFRPLLNNIKNIVENYKNKIY